MCFAQYASPATKLLIHDCLFQEGHTKHKHDRDDQHLDTVQKSMMETGGRREMTCI